MVVINYLQNDNTVVWKNLIFRCALAATRLCYNPKSAFTNVSSVFILANRDKIEWLFWTETEQGEIDGIMVVQKKGAIKTSTSAGGVFGYSKLYVDVLCGRGRGRLLFQAAVNFGIANKFKYINLRATSGEKKDFLSLIKTYESYGLRIDDARVLKGVYTNDWASDGIYMCLSLHDDHPCAGINMNPEAAFKDKDGPAKYIYEGVKGKRHRVHNAPVGKMSETSVYKQFKPTVSYVTNVFTETLIMLETAEHLIQWKKSGVKDIIEYWKYVNASGTKWKGPPNMDNKNERQRVYLITKEMIRGGVEGWPGLCDYMKNGKKTYTDLKKTIMILKPNKDYMEFINGLQIMQ